jgi:hypothetical protein
VRNSQNSKNPISINYRKKEKKNTENLENIPKKQNNSNNPTEPQKCLQKPQEKLPKSFSQYNSKKILTKSPKI